MSDARAFAERLSALRKRSSRYRSQHLDATLGIANTRLITELPRGQVLSADSSDGPVILKLFLHTEIPRARSTVCLQRLYERRGVLVPELVYTDLGNATEIEYGLGCIVTRFVEGHSLRRGDASEEQRVFENLARIHAVSPDDIATLSLPGVSVTDDGEPLPLGPIPRIERKYPNDVRAASTGLETRFRRLDPAEVALVARWREETEKSMAEFGLPRTMLHGDYNRSNVILSPSGQPYTIDLDSMQEGPFRIELATSLLRFLFGAKSRLVHDVDFRELIADSRLFSAEEAYFALAPESAREFWLEHREQSLLLAYLWMIARCSIRAQRPHRDGFVRRFRFRSEGYKLMGRLVAHLKMVHGART